MSMDRRRFVELSAGMVAGLVLPACASVATTRVTPLDGAIRIAVRNHPSLSAPGGYLKLQPDGATTPIYLLAMDGGDYVAVSPICTHLGCTVDIAGDRLICPCHGSTYARDGAVLRGPAERPLRRYAVQATPDGEVVIFLNGGA